MMFGVVFNCCSRWLSALCIIFFFFKQKTAYEMRISDWSSDVCSSDLSALLERLNSLLPQRAVSINEFNATKRLIINPGGEPFVYDQKLTQIGRASCRERVCQYV